MIVEALVTLGIGVLGLIVKAVADSLKDRGTISSLHALRNTTQEAITRVAVVESRVDNQDNNLERIEGSINRLHEKLDKLNDRLGAR